MAIPKRSSQQSRPQRRTRRVTNQQPHNPRPQRSQRRCNQRRIPDVPDLPDDVIERVLAFLPIKEAVKAGTVAKRYVRSWSLSRHLMFDINGLVFRPPQELAQLIDGVFDSHKGPEILTFTLSMDPHGVEPSTIERWLRICIQKGLQNLDWSFFHQGFSFGAELLDIPTLRTLKFSNCIVQLPLPSFKPFHFLHSIVLKRIQLDAGVIQLLVFYSKMLSYLDIVMCTGFRNMYFYARDHKHFKTLKIGSCPEVERIAIDAPALKSFFYSGHVPVIRILNVTRLDEAYFRFMPPRKYFIQPYDMEILAFDLFHVGLLTISAPFIEALSARFRGQNFRDAKFVLSNLKELQLYMEGGVFCNPFDIAMFLSHCPNLETLFIDMNGYYFDNGAYWQIHQKPYLDNFSHCFSQLKFVKLMGFKFLGPDLDFVKVLLQKSTMLQALYLISPKSGGRKHCPRDPTKYTQLFQSWKVAPAARVVLYEYRYDSSSLYPTHNKYWY